MSNVVLSGDQKHKKHRVETVSSSVTEARHRPEASGGGPGETPAGRRAGLLVFCPDTALVRLKKNTSFVRSSEAEISWTLTKE